MDFLINFYLDIEYGKALTCPVVGGYVCTITFGWKKVGIQGVVDGSTPYQAIFQNQ